MENETNLSALTHHNKIKALITFDRENELIEELGWFEHTSDWDPFLLIELTDGSVIETAAGYSYFYIIGYQKNRTISEESAKITQIRVYPDSDADLDAVEIEASIIEIKNIVSIKWRAH